MKHALAATGAVLIYMLFTLSSCSVKDEMPAKPVAPAPAVKAPDVKAVAEKVPAKAKVEKARGDVGLLDLDKNYMILVTKEGKLITLDFDQKTKITKITPTSGKISDVGLGSSATVTYTKQPDKNVASGLEYTPVKSGD